MEALLLAFYNLNTTSIIQKEVSEKLNISQKHLARSLKRWQEDGILSYKSGLGRGNPTEIIWHINIDDAYFKQVYHQFDKQPLDELVTYLTWSWSEASRLALLMQANLRLGVDREHNDKLIIQKRYAPITLNPLDTSDINTFNILSNIYDTLVIYEDDAYHFKIAHHINVFETEAVIYLRKNVLFHDGTLLNAHHVIHCLKTAKKSKQMQRVLEVIHSIEYINDYQIKLTYKHCPYILDVLCTLNLGIYKVVNQQFIGTGPFYIEKNTEAKTTLKSFDRYYGYTPFLDAVELIYVPEIKSEVFDITQTKDVREHTVVDGFYYIMALKQQQLTINQQATVHYILQNELKSFTDRQNISQDGPKILKNSRYFKQSITLESNFTVRLIYPEYIEKLMFDVKRLLKQYHIDAELVPVTFEKAVQSNMDYKADYYLHGAFLNGVEYYQYFTLLFQQSMFYYHLSAQYPLLDDIYQRYIHSPIEEWPRISVIADRLLEKHHLLIPLFNSQKTHHIPNNLHGTKPVLQGFYNWSDIYIE